jgi:hypothetical protein
MNLLRREYVVVTSLILISLSMTAQEKKEPEARSVVVPDQNATPLPKIDLPEFLITGQEAIDLPASTKPAAEEDKVYIPGAAAPGRKDVRIDMAQKPEGDLAGPTGQMNGKVLAGIGTFTSPFLEGWFGKNYDQGGFLFHADYASSQGYVTNANWQKTGIGVSGNFLPPSNSGFFAGSQLNGGLSFSGNTYRAYGSTVAPSQVRTFDNTKFNLGLASSSAAPGLLDAPLEYSAGVVWAGTSLDDSADASENDVGVTASATSEKWGIPLHGSMEYLSSGVTMRFPGNAETHSPQWFALRISGQRILSPVFQASVALQQFIYRGNFGVMAGRFLPVVDLRYFATDAAAFFLSFEPAVERNSLSTLVNSNRYMQNSAPLQPSEIPISLSLGSDLTVDENLRGRASVTYRSIRDFPYFLELNSAKVWDVVYLPKVSETRGDLEGSYRLSQGSSATLAASLNSTMESDSANSVPNIPAFSLFGVYRRTIDAGVNVEGNVRYMSKRWTSFTHSASNAGFVDVGVKGDCQILDNLRAILEIKNLFSQHYYLWDGYVEQPIFISLGVTYKW